MCVCGGGVLYFLGGGGWWGGGGGGDIGLSTAEQVASSSTTQR